jgi:CRP-like cAMP-binding protein
LKKTVVKIVSKPDYLSFLRSDLENLQLWDTLLQGLILQQLEREIDILTSSPVERYKRVLKRSPQLFQEIPHKHIASYLRMTPETLSRIKKS